MPARTFKALCPVCSSTMRANGSDSISPFLKRAVYNCNNSECGHIAYLNISFSHTVSPSALEPPEGVDHPNLCYVKNGVLNRPLLSGKKYVSS